MGPKDAAGHTPDFCRSIVQYELAQGRVLLEHAYPKNASPIPRVWADASLVLETTKPSTLAEGVWINIIGYTQAPPRPSRKKNAQHLQHADLTASLQAVLIWDAGTVRIGDYEHTLEEQNRVQRQSRSDSD